MKTRTRTFKAARSVAAAFVWAMLMTTVACNAPTKTGDASQTAPPRPNIFAGIFGQPAVSENATGATAEPTLLTPLTSAEQPQDPQPAVPVVFHVDVYHLSLPIGALSTNPAFWNRLNEQILDPSTYDILQRNGLRVGEAPFSDWEFFRKLIDEHPGTVAQAQTVAREAKNLELVMNSNAVFQNVFWYDSRNQLVGQSFDDSENLFSVSFQPTPRKPGYMRLTVSPIVRSKRKRLEFSRANNELSEVQFVNPEMLYDCNLRLDVPIESFIVIAPNAETIAGSAAVSSSIGTRFLVKQGASQREEQVMIIVPRPYRVGEEPKK